MTIYIVQTHGPEHPSSWHGQDMLLALATLELNPQLVLLGDALDHWRVSKDVVRHNRSLQKRYGLLELYDCPAPLLASDTLSAEALPEDDWLAEYQALSYADIAARLALSDKVMRF
ncbi:DsrE family protein [Pseudidiomarina sediminum]|uniref:DsrE family protein n=1 Tax=Pseudidiomarina sediminum TaxID=431675 RepID=UPI001C983123|nr:DsrE family protein [Pseudidiomarina sediminum]MBY6063041.1 DsrE family protein [Pseudidiomarina sediminum]